FRAPDIRGVIAYSSLAQLGLITFGVFAVNDLGLNGAVLQMVNHGLITGSLFLLAGGIERRATTGEFARLGGFARGRPIRAIVPLLACLLALSVWPAAITERSFAGDRAATAVTNQFRVAAGRPRLDYILVGRSVGSEQQHSCLKKYRQALKAGRYGKASSLA